MSTPENEPLIITKTEEFSPYSILYDPMKYVQPEPLIVETPDFKCTIEYKCSPDVLVHNYGAGNL